MSHLPEQIVSLKDVGQEIIEALETLKGAISSTSSPPSEDPTVLQALDTIRTKVKTFKTMADTVRQANDTFLKTQPKPTASVQINYNQLLHKIQCELQAIELENDQTKRALEETGDACDADILEILECAKRVALTCSAPPGWDQTSPIWPYRPPYPTEDLIRSSDLFMKMSAVDQSSASAAPKSERLSHRLTGDQKYATAEEKGEEGEDIELLKGLDIASL